MPKKKFPMPTAEEFLKRKRLNDPRGEPVWIRLEKEMQQNINKKPYNEKVGKWLAWLKDYKDYQHRQGVKVRKELANDVGPPWFCEYSNQQIKLLDSLKATIHQDLVDRMPSRTRQALIDIGVSCRLSRSVLLKAMDGSEEDPGIFIWHLYSLLFNKLPTELLPKYGINQMLLMSAMVFIDLKECIEKLELLTYAEEPELKPVKKTPCKSFTPDVKLGPYLQTFCVPSYTPDIPRTKNVRRPFEHKVRVRMPEEFEEIRNDLSFLQRRKERNLKKDMEEDRRCVYPFWIPPSRKPRIPIGADGPVDPKNKEQSADVLLKMKMLKKRAAPKFKAPYKHEQYHITGVVFCQNTPQYLLSTMCILPTGYTPITQGVVQVKDLGFITSYSGHWEFPPYRQNACDKTCDCMTKWESDVMNYLNETKCKCGHYYDFNHTGKAKEKYFYQPTQYHPWWLDRAKIFQMDPMEDFIKECVAKALRSESTAATDRLHVKATGLTDRELLAVFFADLNDSCLIIPHLPKANYLNSLLNWTRNRVRGPLSPNRRKQLDFRVIRKWTQLRNIDFKAPPYRIPFTHEELDNMTWEHRSLIQKLRTVEYSMWIALDILHCYQLFSWFPSAYRFGIPMGRQKLFLPITNSQVDCSHEYTILLNNFLKRNRVLLLKQSRYWWPTMLPEIYSDSVFRDIFFTYMPGRAKDSYLIDPYDAFTMVKPNTGNSCPP